MEEAIAASPHQMQEHWWQFNLMVGKPSTFPTVSMSNTTSCQSGSLVIDQYTGTEEKLVTTLQLTPGEGGNNNLLLQMSTGY